MENCRNCAAWNVGKIKKMILKTLKNIIRFQKHNEWKIYGYFKNEENLWLFSKTWKI